MPMQENELRQYIQQAGLVPDQLDQAVGEFTVDPVSAEASHVTPDNAEKTRQAVRQVGAEAAAIAAKYNQIAKRTNRNVTQAVSQSELDADRAKLESLIGDEYRFMNPFGNIEGKQRTIDVILNGRILYESYGSGGFETTEDSLQVHGNTAVLISEFSMAGAGQARRRDTGEIYEQDLTGTYRTTHTFVFRDKRWQYTASQMTQVPPEQPFVFVADEEEGYQ